MLYLIIGGSITFLVIIGSVFFISSYIRKKYEEYDKKETLKEEISFYNDRIKEGLKYFHETYCNDFDHAIYENARINEDFIRKLILKRPLEKQAYYFKKLYERLYEMAYRVKENSNDVVKIISPLKTLRDELVREQIDYLNEMTKDDNF